MSSKERFEKLKEEARKKGCIDDPEIKKLIARLEINLNNEDIDKLEELINTKS